MASFGNLYNYVTSTGIIIPLHDFDDIKLKVSDAFKGIFGSDIDTSTQTAVGRLIEAITLLFIDILGINAQNSNNINPSVAVGAFLDALGALFGVNRLSGESDESYRTRILEGQSIRQGYVQSIRSAISRVPNVRSICVLENNKGENADVPNGNYGVNIPPHSIFVCVGAENTSEMNNAIANAIYKTKSAGCGYTTDTQSGGATSTDVTITDTDTHSTTHVYFYHPLSKGIDINVTVDGASYTGTDIVADVKAAIKSFIAKRAINSYITPALIAAAISTNGSGIYCTSSTIGVHGAGEALDYIPARPWEELTVNDGDYITVNVL